jgi:hypothetical protein
MFLMSVVNAFCLFLFLSLSLSIFKKANSFRLRIRFELERTILLLMLIDISAIKHFFGVFQLLCLVVLFFCHRRQSVCRK